MFLVCHFLVLSLNVACTFYNTFTICRRYVKNSQQDSFFLDVKAFQLTEMHGLMTSPEDFQTQYVKPVAKKLNERTIYHGVIATHKVNRLRNCMLRPDTYVLIHCADSIDKLKAFYDSREYTFLEVEVQNILYKY